MSPFDTEESTEGLLAALEARREGNPQLYENSPLSNSSIEKDWQENPDKLYGSKPPNLALLKESPRHRLAIFLKAQSLSNREIAARLGFSEAWVCQILRQPWAQERLVLEIQESGRDAVTALLQGASVDSIHRLIVERDNVKATAQARINASEAILNRLYGKPTQRVESFNTNVTAQSFEDLNAQLRALEAEEARLTGRAPQVPDLSGEGAGAV